jgi:hypothetical protein
MAAADEPVIQSREDFSDDPEGWAKRWTVEFAAAREFVSKWHDSGDRCVKAFGDQRDAKRNEDKESHANLYWANVLMQMALMYGRIPEVDVSRRYNDANDQTARIAGPIILQRLLNTDIERDEDGYRKALRHALSDFLTVGFCNSRVRYVAEFEENGPADRMEEEEPGDTEGDEEQEPATMKTPDSEDVVTDYIYWKDQLWSPARTFEDWRWWAYKTLMSKDDVEKRFGKDVAKNVPYNAKSIRYAGDEVQHNDVFSRVEVWEVWNKEDKKVYWFIEGYKEVLDIRDDPYQLHGFWPFPEPLMANLTTEASIPRPDYAMAQDLYEAVNEQTSRIALLEKSLKVAGVYDERNEPIQRLLTEGRENILIPIKRFDELKEGGGLKGAIDWWPLDQVVAALEKLRDQRQETMQLLYEVTGQGELMRGAPMQGSGDVSGTEAAGAIRFGSARVQYRQDEFARFASGLQQLRAELIVKLFEPATIIKRSNVLMTNDAIESMQAVEMLKKEFPTYRIVIRPEAIAQQDFASLQNERTQFLTAFSGLLRDAMPALSAGPFASMAGLVIGELLKWAIAGFRGAKEVEGVLDKAIQAAQQQMQQQQQGGQNQPPPDPKLQELQLKSQGDMQRMQMKAQLDAQHEQLVTQQEMVRQQIQTQANVQQTAAQERIKLASEAHRAAMRPPPALRPAGKKRPGEELL